MIENEFENIIYEQRIMKENEIVDFIEYFINKENYNKINKIKKMKKTELERLFK